MLLCNICYQLYICGAKRHFTLLQNTKTPSGKPSTIERSASKRGYVMNRDSIQSVVYIN